MYTTKTFPAEVKDIDQQSGIVTGYFAAFGNVDSDNEAIRPGAFAKSIKENGPDSPQPRIMHLYQHDTFKPLAKPHVLQEDKHGLYFESKVADTSYGKDVLKLYEAGVINEHSIGFETIRSEEAGDHTDLTEVKLWEGSTVTWGANHNTPFVGFKTKSRQEVLDHVDRLAKAARKGTFTDETFHLLEIQLKQLQQYLSEVLPQDSPSEDTDLVLSKADLTEIVTTGFRSL